MVILEINYNNLCVLMNKIKFDKMAFKIKFMI